MQASCKLPQNFHFPIFLTLLLKNKLTYLHTSMIIVKLIL